MSVMAAQTSINSATTLQTVTPIVSSALATNSATTLQTIVSSSSLGAGNVTNANALLRTYMALGDSFSAGNGAGVDASPAQPNCHRTQGSYVMQLLNDPDIWQFTTQPNRFQFNACSGYVTTQIQNEEILNPTAQNPPFNPFIEGATLYTMSAGGNDLGFDKVVRTCVYNFGLWGSCQKNLQAVDAAVQSGSLFDLSLTQLYNTLFQRAQGGQVIIVPYIQFYNDQVPSTYGTSCHVSQSIRQQMNDRVITVNNFLALHAAKYDGFSMLSNDALQSAYDGHRFCDKGDVWIQDSLLSSLSPQAQQQWNLNGTLPAAVNAQLNGTFAGDGSTNDDSDDDSDGDNGNLRNIFHPTFAGHTAYKELIKGAISPAAQANTNATTYDG